MNDPNKDEGESTPTGAIFVTTVLAVTILALWLAIYLLNMVRS